MKKSIFEKLPKTYQKKQQFLSIKIPEYEQKVNQGIFLR